MDHTNVCPECNAHWLTLDPDILIVVPNHRLPHITNRETGVTQYLTQKELVAVLARDQVALADRG